MTTAPPLPCTGLIEGTADGGLTWSPQYRAPLAISDLDVVDPRHVYALGTPATCASSGESCPTIVLATSDGVTWSIAYETLETITGLYFANARTGWLAEHACTNQTSTCAGRIMVTGDGGTSWADQLDTDQPPLAIGGWGSVVWVAAPGTSSSYASGLELFHTTTAGGNWSAPSQVGATASSPFGAPQMDAESNVTLTFSSPDVGWIDIFSRDTCENNGCLDWVYETTDGGADWTSNTPPPRADCSSQGYGGPVVLAADGTGGEYAFRTTGRDCPTGDVLWRSPSSSANWAVVHQWAQAAVSVMAWPAPGDGWAVADGAVIHTSNAGPWEQVMPAPFPTESLAVGAHHTLWGTGITSDAGAVLVSHDGGQSWGVVARLPGWAQYLSVAGHRLWVLVASFDDSSSVWEAATTNAMKWRQLSAVPQAAAGPSFQNLMGPDFVDHAYVQGFQMFGSSGVVLASTQLGMYLQYRRTTDRGRTWSRGVPTSLQSFWATDFDTDRHGWVLVNERIGSGTELATTDNGARSWKRVADIPDDLTPLAMQFRGTDGWILATNAVQTLGTSGEVLLFSANGGLGWRTAPVPPAMHASSQSVTENTHVPYLTFANHRDGWLLAGDGVWKTTDGGNSWSPL